MFELERKRNKMQIYVGNMNYRTTEEDINGLFSQYGEVQSVKLISDRETGRAKGFGFVTMNDDTAAKEAIEALNEKEFEGRTLRINEAKPREERPRREY
jgi:RNA recognition motif-containing protein